MKKLGVFVLLLLLLLFSCQEETPLKAYQIIPEPLEISYSDGYYKLKKNITISYSDSLKSEANYLKSLLEEEFTISSQLKESKKSANINLRLNPSVLPEQKEGYKLEVYKNGVTISSSTTTGIFYGIQSLRQIISSEEDGKYFVQKGVITDYPNFSWRAFMLDEARYFKGKEVVYELLDEMSRLKINTFHWHLTNDQGWRIEIKKYPKLTEIGAFRDSSEINHFHSNIYDGKPHGGFYTQDEIKDIISYAEQRHINIVPEISMPGHACAAIAAYPWLGTKGNQIQVPSNFGVHYPTFNVVDPKVMEFFADVIDEVISLFPSPVIHIGGDEVRYDHWKSSPEVRKYMTENNLNTPAELQVFFTNEISKIIESKGRRMMGWNEVTGQQLHSYQSKQDTEDVKQDLSTAAIVHFWKGDPKLMLETVQKGHEVVNSWHVYTYLDYSYKSIPLKKSYEFNPIPEDIPVELRNKVIGLGCQMWSEFITNTDELNNKVYPRLAAYAEVGWTPLERKDYERFLESLSLHLKRWQEKGIEYGEVN